ncbi:hypothetical protein Asppvi_000600 [Aspergillus pseudoviridinutans]|uniref:Uncharacterized protein n=1 Tax=Aspergillus pseudoviridinutans TaxID=1517512 RepID=A0A9P3B1R8_9EURO|nr:uncharacterized protein Asppvi_000600 [Aspergillus pseudoviridinutans]GIJ82097.1 hypothetical protein Asppvi_000600 [Aspergillus pseudoviridinutans]
MAGETHLGLPLNEGTLFGGNVFADLDLEPYRLRQVKHAGCVILGGDSTVEGSGLMRLDQWDNEIPLC